MYSLNEINKQNNKDKVTRVIQYLKSKDIEKEYCSTNTVNIYANALGVELTSQQVKSISKNYR